MATVVLAETPAQAKTAPHYPALDGVRGLAVLSVMMLHFTAGYHGSNPIFRAWSPIAELGWMGVDLFFVLSGFLITGIIRRSIANPHRARNFYARRALRIFPLYYAVLIACLLLTPVFHLHWQPVHALYFVYLGNMVNMPPLGPPGQSLSFTHFWSLAVEEQFYLLWPFIVWRIHDRRKLLKVIVAILIASPILRIALLLAGVPAAFTGFLLFTRADSLLYGALISVLLEEGRPALSTARKVLVAASLLIAVTYPLALRVPGGEPAWRVSMAYSLIGMGAASLVCLCAVGSGLLARIFSQRILRFFGKYSYGIYIYHGLYAAFLRHWISTQPVLERLGSLSTPMGAVLGGGIAVAIAFLSYNYFEAPLLRMKDRFA
jgi:peptidoglycan/LPS O-acetylase OafA/YrhL